jgi:hypothetical protein
VSLRKDPASVPLQPPNTARPAPPPPARPVQPLQASAVVRVRLESKPPGARIVRVSDGVVLGTTPETIELRPSSEPLPLRFEKEGFLPAVEVAPLSADSSLSVVLEAAPEKPASPTTRKHASGKSHGSNAEAN